MSERKAAVEEYFEGFRRTDRAAILALLTDDVVWDLPGYKHLEGKAAFDGEIVGEGFEGSPALELDRLIEEGDTVVAIGSGSAQQTTGETARFVYCDVFTFTGARICRVESYLVPLTADG